VFSIGVNYTAVQNIVRRYCDYFELKKSIKEYDYLYKEDYGRIENDKANTISEKIFNKIEEFVLENKDDEKYNADKFKLFSFS